VEGVVKTPACPSPRQDRPTSWRKRGDEDHIRIAGFFGGSKSKSNWDDMDIAVCTIEKVGWTPCSQGSTDS